MSDTLEVEQTETLESDEQDQVQYQITSYPADMTIRGYLDKDNGDQLIIPDFQRNYVWDQTKASKLIESFLLGLPVPGVFLYKDRKSNKLLIIDGQQRITSALRFIRGAFDEKVFRLKGVNSRWEGKTYSELDEAEQIQINDSVLRATIIQQLDPQDDSSIYYIFERLNTGGINLTPMEVRRCVYYGDLVLLLEKLNEYPNWRKIIGTDQPDKRLRDVELLLRCLAMKKNWKTYEKPMKGFLNQYMTNFKKLDNQAAQEELKEIEDSFYKTCDQLIRNLNEKPFNVYGRLNFALMDSIFVATSYAHPDTNIEEKYRKLLSDSSFENMCRVSTSDEKSVQGRISLAMAEIVGL